MDSPAPSDPFAEAAITHPTPRQRRILWSALTAVATMSLLVVGALIFYGFITFLTWSYPILLPIGLAVIIALVLDPFVCFLQKRGLKRDAASITVCLLTAIGFLLFWAFLLPPIVKQAGGFFKSLPTVLNSGAEKLDASLGNAPESNPPAPTSAPPVSTPPSSPNQPATNQAPALPSVAPAPSNPESDHSAIQAFLRNNLPGIEKPIQKNLANFAYSALGPVGQAFGFLLGFGFVPIYVYYFLADQTRITHHWHELVPLRHSSLRDEVVSVIGEISRSLTSYFRGQIIVAACNGVLTFIGLWVIGVPYSLVLGIITGALSIVPFLGIICSIIPALLLGFLSAKNDPTLQWLRPVLVLGVFTLVQVSESMFITPRVQSHSTGLHPLAIIIGILFWSMLLPGLLGPIVAVPLTCAVVVLLRRYVWLEKKTV